MWPISKSGFEDPVIDVHIPDSVITSVVEYSVSLVYVSTNKGKIIEVNVKNRAVTPIYSIENDVFRWICGLYLVYPKYGFIFKQHLLLYWFGPSLSINASN